MSLGEIVSLYRSRKLVIHPAYQRLFQWNESQKTLFIESVLLGLAVPPIFVFQRKNGTWELLDGLQPVMTLLQLTGDLLSEEGQPIESLVLAGTPLLPALAGMSWLGPNPEEDDDDDYDQPDPNSKAFSIQMRLDVRRARIHVEILRNECGQEVKLALFQRLNSNGWKLGQKDIRQAGIAMNKPKAATTD
jgi:uncharacterized protein with ParB-like and HNH nuclease domain